MPVAMFAAALLLVAQPASGQENFGLAVTGGTNEACVAMPGAAGSMVTLVTPGLPKVVVTATVEGASASCTLDKSAREGPYFRLRPRGAVPEHRTVWVAFRGELPPGIQIHECTSSEGVHYTVWSGEPLKSRRLWHAYYYLGYDVEPSCRQRIEVED